MFKKFIGITSLAVVAALSSTSAFADNKAQEIIDSNNLDEEETVEAMKEAAYFGKKASYNYKPEGTAGAVSDFVNYMTRMIPAIRHIIPFSTILCNVTDVGMDYTPWGYKRAKFGKGAFVSKLNATYRSEAPIGTEYRIAMSKAHMGTALILAAGIGVATGLVTITAGEPKDKKKKYALRALNSRDFSIKVGPISIDYSLMPIAPALAFTAAFVNSYKEDMNKEEKNDLLGRFTLSALAGVSVIFNQSFFSSAREFMDLLSEAENGVMYNVVKATRKFSGAFIPNILRQIDQIYDPTYYKPSTIQQAIISNLPILRRGLYPLRDIWGEPVKSTRSILYSLEKKDDILRWEIDNDAYHTMPSPRTQLNGVIMSSEQYDYYFGHTLGTFHTWMENNFARLQNMPIESAKKEMKKAQKKINEQTKADMIRAGM